MSDKLLNERELNFQLYEMLDTEALLQRPRYAEHDRAVFDATLETARGIAAEFLAPHNQKGDANEPTFDGEKVTLIPETKAAWDALAEAGFHAAHHDAEDGGLQLPEVILRSCVAYFSAANISTSGYSFLTIGSANLVKGFASDALRERFLPPMLDGRYSGTMALTEPGQGSALGDIRTTARPTADGSYRVFGQKMFISGGDHELTDNIVHMVLARIEGAPAGVKGISLFLVPKVLVNEDGSLGARNDVALAGLLHKMGYRNTTSTVLSFGEKDGAVGYLVGEANKGLSYMFQMMNEARIGVALGASVLAYQSYIHALAYARERPQGRLPGSKDPLSNQVRIVQHADVRRMLLQQKVYAEGSLSLCLYASSLFEDSHTAPTEAEREDANELLDLLIPMVKSYPSKYGVIASDLGIQILGGSGYIREYPLEQYYRDNRLNPIHEGTHGIQGQDLLGRKVTMAGGRFYQSLLTRIRATLDECANVAELKANAELLSAALSTVEEVTEALQAMKKSEPDRALAHAYLYMECFGHLVVGWLWLRQAQAALLGLQNGGERPASFYQGKLNACDYFLRYELPKPLALAEVLRSADRTTLDMPLDCF